MKQACMLCSQLYTIVIDEAKTWMRKMNLEYWKMQGIYELLYIDDVVIMAEKEKNLQVNLNILTLSNANMKVNVDYTCIWQLRLVITHTPFN